MSAIDVLIAGIGIVVLGVPIVFVGWAARRFLNRRHQTRDELSERGPVGTLEMPLVLGIIIGGLGTVLLGVGVIPLAVWVFDNDPDARRAFIAMCAVFGFFALGGFAIAWPGLRFWLLEPRRLTVARLGRERSIGYSDVVSIHERRTLTGSVEVRSATAKIRVPQQLSGYDEFLSRLRAAVPDVAVTSRREGRTGSDTKASPPAAVRLHEVGRFDVPGRRTFSTLGLLIVLLLFFWIGPWFVVNGDKPVRDAIIFMGIGTLIWAMFAFLIGAETFQRHQPAHLELRATEIAYRAFRKQWVVHRDDELVSASVETRIRHVKGMAGYLYPLVLVFVDGTRVELDQMRAKHMATSTHQLAEQLRRRYFDETRRTTAQRETASRELGDAIADVASGDTAGAVGHYQRAVASLPSADNIRRYKTVGDLQRQLQQFEPAVSSYRAYLDFHPNDAGAWEGLAAALRHLGRLDLAAEATQSAERILLNT